MLGSPSRCIPSFQCIQQSNRHYAKYAETHSNRSLVNLQCLVSRQELTIPSEIQSVCNGPKAEMNISTEELFVNEYMYRVFVAVIGRDAFAL